MRVLIKRDGQLFYEHIDLLNILVIYFQTLKKMSYCLERQILSILFGYKMFSKSLNTGNFSTSSDATVV